MKASRREFISGAADIVGENPQTTRWGEVVVLIRPRAVATPRPIKIRAETVRHGKYAPASGELVFTPGTSGVKVISHCPIDTPRIRRAANKYWKRDNLKSVWDANGWKEPRREPVTRDFVAYLKAQPLLKGILAGHYHIDVADRFSPTANEFLVGGNFLFHGQEITIS